MKLHALKACNKKGRQYVKRQILYQFTQWQTMKTFQENDPRAGRKV